jgi:hypothetical protein
MAIEAGLVALIQTGLADTVQGGFGVILPKDFINSTNTQAWCYRTILSIPQYVLSGEQTFTRLEIQFDCHGYQMSDAISLAAAITSTLSGGWHGTLSSGEVVLGIYRLPSQVDGYDDINRTFIRSLEYQVQYYITT